MVLYLPGHVVYPVFSSSPVLLFSDLLLFAIFCLVHATLSEHTSVLNGANHSYLGVISGRGKAICSPILPEN